MQEPILTAQMHTPILWGDDALIAQLDRAFDYGSKGFGFDS